MSKYVAVYAVNGYSKEGTDRKGIIETDEDSVTTRLVPDSWNPGREVRKRPDQQILLHTPETLSPEWGDHFLVTIEKLPPKPEGKDWQEFLKETCEAKKKEGTVKPLLPSRKFR
jgi:hypothetical protein